MAAGELSFATGSTKSRLVRACRDNNGLRRHGTAHSLGRPGNARAGGILVTARLHCRHGDGMFAAADNRILGSKRRGGSKVDDEARILLRAFPNDGCAGAHAECAIALRVGDIGRDEEP